MAKIQNQHIQLNNIQSTIFHIILLFSASSFFQRPHQTQNYGHFLGGRSRGRRKERSEREGREGRKAGEKRRGRGIRVLILLGSVGWLLFQIQNRKRQPITQKIHMVPQQMSHSLHSGIHSPSEQVETMDQSCLPVQIQTFATMTPTQIRREQVQQDSQSEESALNPQLGMLASYSRKEKSLMELSRKFISKFEGALTDIVVLDQVTNELRVERRRIYDIINIMESLAIVSKIKKNIYQWKGLIKAVETIHNITHGSQCQSPDRPRKEKSREKSLESLSTEFLKLFCSRKDCLTLEEASLILLSEASEQMKKTKVRRLYDIINVFKCLGLVEKIKNPRSTGSKPIYRWIGCSTMIKMISEKNSSNVENMILQNPEFIAKSKQGSGWSSSSLNQGLRDISNIPRFYNSSSTGKHKNIVIKQCSSFITTKHFQEVEESLEEEDRRVGDSPSFFQHLGKVLNWDQASTLSEIQHKLRESIWPTN